MAWGKELCYFLVRIAGIMRMVSLALIQKFSCSCSCGWKLVLPSFVWRDDAILKQWMVFVNSALSPYSNEVIFTPCY